MMEGGVVKIGWVELFCSAALMLVAGIISWKLELGQEKRIVVSTVRCFLQLLACGLLLGYIFEFQSWWLVIVVLVCMTLAATQIAASRVKTAVRGLFWPVFASIGISSIAVLFIVVDAVIGAVPWFSARTVIPIGGMVLGNTMSAVAVALDRLYADMDSREDEMTMLLSLGATPREAAIQSIRASVSAGLTPTLATMSAAGIVSIPGMMSGQILAGSDPLGAAKYQIVILIMISAATTVSIMLACFLTYRKRFAKEGYYLRKSLRNDG